MNLGKLEPEELGSITGNDLDISTGAKYSGCSTIAYANDILVTYTGEDS